MKKTILSILLCSNIYAYFPLEDCRTVDNRVIIGRFTKYTRTGQYLASFVKDQGTRHESKFQMQCYRPKDQRLPFDFSCLSTRVELSGMPNVSRVRFRLINNKKSGYITFSDSKGKMHEDQIALVFCRDLDMRRVRYEEEHRRLGCKKEEKVCSTNWGNISYCAQKCNPSI